jgi:hypothetical protein
LGQGLAALLQIVVTLCDGQQAVPSKIVDLIVSSSAGAWCWLALALGLAELTSSCSRASLKLLLRSLLSACSIDHWLVPLLPSCPSPPFTGRGGAAELLVLCSVVSLGFSFSLTLDRSFWFLSVFFPSALFPAAC